MKEISCGIVWIIRGMSEINMNMSIDEDTQSASEEGMLAVSEVMTFEETISFIK